AGEEADEAAVAELLGILAELQRAAHVRRGARVVFLEEPDDAAEHERLELARVLRGRLVGIGERRRQLAPEEADRGALRVGGGTARVDLDGARAGGEGA